MKGSDLVRRSRGEYADICCYDFERFRRVGPGYLAEAQDLLLEAKASYDAGHMRKGVYDQLGKSLGYHANERGMCACSELRKYIDFAQVATYDWAHSALQDGVLTGEVHLLISKLEELELCSFQQLEAYFKNGWSFPASMSSKGAPL